MVELETLLRKAGAKFDAAIYYSIALNELVTYAVFQLSQLQEQGALCIVFEDVPTHSQRVRWRSAPQARRLVGPGKEMRVGC